MRRNNFGTSKLSRRCKELMTGLAPYAAAASAALILWHAARDTPPAQALVPAPLVYPKSPAGATPPHPSAAVQPGPRAIVQQECMYMTAFFLAKVVDAIG